MSEAKKKRSLKPLPPMGELLDILTTNNLLSEDDKTLFEFMAIDSSELSDDATIEDSPDQNIVEASSEDVDECECSDDAKSFALTLYYHAPEAYDYLRTQYNTCLPPLPILWTWYVHPGGLPGFSQESLQAIENKVKNSQDKIYCALTFKSLKDYSAGDTYVDGKGYFGFEDFGSKIETDCQNKATDALFFMATAVNGTWSLPVGYFLLRNTHKKLASVIKIAIYLLEKSGVEVVALSYDNWCVRAVEALGCELKQEDLKTTFKSESNREICAFPDYNGLREDICQRLSWFKEFTDGDGNKIAWKFISQLGKKGKRSSAADNNEVITDRDKRILSRAVAGCLLQHKELKSPSFAGVEGTIKFINNLNDLMDILNSQENGTELKQAISDENKSVVIEKLDHLIEYFMSIKSKQPVNFTGFSVSGRSLKEMVRLYLDENALKSIPFHKISLEAVEKMFVKIRRYAKVSDIPAYKLHVAYNKVLEEANKKQC